MSHTRKLLFYRPGLRPFPLKLISKRLALRPEKSVWRTIAIIVMFGLTALFGGVYEYFVRDVYMKTWNFEDYRADHFALPPDSNLYYQDMVWETAVSYLCLILATTALFLALRLVWKRILIDISQTEHFSRN